MNEKPQDDITRPLDEIVIWPCIICQKPVPDFEPEYCCDGRDCGCLGQQIQPCVCSDRCYDALMKGIGKSFDERRKDAGIDLYR